MLQAMNTGHDGSLTTIHANSPRETLSRLETLVLMAGLDLPLKAIRQQIAGAINLIIQLNRLKDGSRKIASITEVIGMEGEMITVQEIFKFESRGADPSTGKIIGDFEPTGIRPRIIDRLFDMGIPLPPRLAQIFPDRRQVGVVDREERPSERGRLAATSGSRRRQVHRLVDQAFTAAAATLVARSALDAQAPTVPSRNSNLRLRSPDPSQFGHRARRLPPLAWPYPALTPGNRLYAGARCDTTKPEPVPDQADPTPSITWMGWKTSSDSCSPEVVRCSRNVGMTPVGMYEPTTLPSSSTPTCL